MSSYQNQDAKKSCLTLRNSQSIGEPMEHSQKALRMTHSPVRTKLVDAFETRMLIMVDL